MRRVKIISRPSDLNVQELGWHVDGKVTPRGWFQSIRPKCLDASGNVAVVTVYTTLAAACAVESLSESRISQKFPSLGGGNQRLKHILIKRCWIVKLMRETNLQGSKSINCSLSLDC
jgi:hypothetical protein